MSKASPRFSVIFQHKTSGKLYRIVRVRPPKTLGSHFEAQEYNPNKTGPVHCYRLQESGERSAEFLLAHSHVEGVGRLTAPLEKGAPATILLEMEKNRETV